MSSTIFIDKAAEVRYPGGCVISAIYIKNEWTSWPSWAKKHEPLTFGLLLCWLTNIVAPSGKITAGPLFDKAGALQAQIDLDDIILKRWISILSNIMQEMTFLILKF